MKSKHNNRFVIYLILLTVKVSESIVPDPCPGTDILPRTRVVKMCETGSAVENIDDGNTNVDSVVLSLMENKNHCSCYVSVENMNSNTIIYVKPYNDLTASAPKEQLCGMIIDLFRIYPNQNTQRVKEIPIGCNSGHNLRSLTLTSDNKRLEFVSKVADGNFTRGYCIHISRAHNYGGQDDDKELKLICSNQDQSITTTLQPTTSNFNGSLNKKTDSIDKNTMYISIGAVAGIIVFILVLVMVILLCKRRKRLYSSKEESKAKCSATTKQTVVDEEEYDGLKYNMLYVSSEKDNHFDANYSTVDGDLSRHKRIKKEEGCRTVEDQEHIHNSKLDILFVTKNAQQTNGDKKVNIAALSENGCVYAVVDKSNTTKSYMNNVEIKVSSQTYAIVNETRKDNPK
ncbi:uncharacterized protein LOC127725324 [Mytilus californianus]|uniref:uncharacterized protein LOC127725324 n=1 Tax=Mytilus californianus TaxID=6549 RepID=UPI0022465FDE|nr:uncharacterized protein LOC127725324 [Mytilus californianus]